MCGIAGIVGAEPRAPNEAVLGAMLAALAHRGPDDEDVWREGDVWIGHRRLSIVDLSPAGRQPMVSADGRFVIAFNGEIYNHRAMRSALGPPAGRGWRGHSDVEVFLETIAAVGLEEALARARGMFAFALWDRGEAVLHLARDRFGEKPLYYDFDGSRLLFASELTSLRRAGISEEIDPAALSAYLRYGYVPAPLSILRGARKLPPATRLVWRRGAQPELYPYWDLARLVRDGRTAPPADAEAAADDLHRVLKEVIGEQMRADVPVGAFLSGGLDSSVVAAIMQSLAPAPITSFTMGFEARAFDEAPEAAAVARRLGTDHVEHYVRDEEARTIVPELGSIFDEPFADASQIPTLLMSRLARQRVKVCLTGDGGDEMFGGYVRYEGVPRLWRALAPWPRPARRAAGWLLARAPLALVERGLGGLGPVARRYTSRGSLGPDLRRAAGWLGAGSQSDLHDLTMTAWPRSRRMLRTGGAGGDTRGRPPPPCADDLEAMQWRDTLEYLPGDILTKVDRCSMRYGLETRAPLLDIRVATLAWSMPSVLKQRNGESKWILRRVLGRHLPADLIDRPKKGFSPPLHAWLGGPLREWAETLIGSAALGRSDYLEPEVVAPVWRRFLAGDSAVTQQVWTVLMFQAWLSDSDGRRASRSHPLRENLHQTNAP